MGVLDHTAKRAHKIQVEGNHMKAVWRLEGRADWATGVQLKEAPLIFCKVIDGVMIKDSKEEFFLKEDAC